MGPVPGSISKILDQFSEVLNPQGELRQTTCKVKHFLSTRGPPVASAFWGLDTEKLAAARNEFLAMEQAGVVHCSTSPWGVPLHMMCKADGTWLVGAY